MLMHIKSLLKAKSLLLAIAVTIVIAVLSLIKVGKQPINFHNIDKVEHFIAYAVLSFFWLLALGKTQKSILLLVLVCIFYGMIIEVFQGMTGYRTFDFVDMIANTIGVLIGLFIFLFLIKKKNLTH